MITSSSKIVNNQTTVTSGYDAASLAAKIANLKFAKPS